MCVLDCLAAWPSCASASAHKRMAWHSPVEFSDTEQNSWLLLLRQVVQVLRQQSIPKASHYHHHAWPLVWGSFCGMLCLVSARHNGNHVVRTWMTCLNRRNHEFCSVSDNSTGECQAIRLWVEAEAQLGHAARQWSKTHNRAYMKMAKNKHIWSLSNGLYYCMEEGAKTPPQRRERLINNYRKCLVGVVAAKGGTTSYWV